MRLMRLLGLVAAALLVSAAPPQPVGDRHAADRIRAHVEFLSSDLLEGRDTGARGYDIAANYVAAEFRKLGLTPGGPNGSWFVQVPFRRATLAGTPSIQLTINGRKVQLAPGKDAAIRPNVTTREVSVNAPLVFVGHGVRDARLGIDDYAGLDVRGKIAVALSDRVPGVPSDVAAHLRWVQATTAAEQGAVGYIEIDDPSNAAATIQRFGSRPVLDWVDGGLARGRRDCCPGPPTPTPTGRR